MVYWLCALLWGLANFAKGSHGYQGKTYTDQTTGYNQVPRTGGVNGHVLQAAACITGIASLASCLTDQELRLLARQAYSRCHEDRRVDREAHLGINN